MARSTSGESVLQRTVRILETFGPNARAQGVSEIARRAELPLSTASRLIDDLVSHGLLRRDEQRQIRIGLRLWELATRASPAVSLREAAMPYLEDLHGLVGHHAQLGVLERDEVLFIERLSAPKAVINVTRIAGRLPLHASSSGLVLLAHASKETQNRVLGHDREAFTPATVTEERPLRALLAEIRKLGYAYCPGFIDPAATGIAVPLRDPRGRVIAALSVIVPNDERALAHVALVQATSLAIQRSLQSPRGPAG